MEDNTNKPAAAGGARDISDLKARLGLKKGAPGGPATGTPMPGVPAVGQPIPAPPGFGQAQPAVDPRRDPFGAQAPVAPPAYYGYAPLPGIDDGKPAEQISKPKPWGRIAIICTAIAALFGLGYSCGGIHWARGNMNKTIDQAGDIRVEVEKMSKTLTSVQDIVAPTPENNKLSPSDITEKLSGLDLRAPERDKHLFKTNYAFMEDLAIDRLFNYYNDTIILYGLINQHVKKTDNDKASIESFIKAQGAGGAGGQRNYAVSLDASGPMVLANFAELGSPVCNDEKESDCPADQMKGFKYRTDPGGQWFVKPVKGAPAQVIIPIKPGQLFNQLSKGSPDLLAFESAQRRLLEIRLVTAKLAGEQKELLQQLDKASDKKRKVNEHFIF